MELNMNEVFQRVEAELAVGVSELKRNPAAVIAASQEQAVAILNHNRVVGYLVSPAAWEHAQELHDDARIVEKLDARKREKPVRMSLDEL
jgi:antitoxin StbD